MGFLVTTLIFVVVGIIASLCTRICCNRGPSTNLYASFSLSLQFIYLFFFLKKKHGMRVIQLNCCYCSFQKEEERKVVTCKRLPYPFNWIVNAFPNAGCFHRWSVGIDFLQLIIILRRSFVQNLFYYIYF